MQSDVFPVIESHRVDPDRPDQPILHHTSWVSSLLLSVFARFGASLIAAGVANGDNHREFI